MKPWQTWNGEDLIREILRKEPDASKYIQSFMSIVDPAVGIIRYFGKEKNSYSDEPKITAYRAELTPTIGFSDGGYPTIKAEGGRSNQPDMAMVAAIFEGLERYCLSIYREDDFEYTSYADLRAAGRLALDPSTLVSSEKVEMEEQADVYRQQVMGWTTGWSLRHEQEILVPAQCVFLPYKFRPNEPILRDPLTTGAASGLTIGGAILRGLMEVIERDAITLIHYRQKACQQMDVSNADATLQALIDSLNRYHLDFRLYDYGLDLPVAVVACKLLDPTGIGPALTLGAKASFDLHDAARGAILEAGSIRLGLRGQMEEVRQEAQEVMHDYSQLQTTNLRTFLWSQPEMVPHLDYLDQTEGVSTPSQKWDGITEERLRALLDAVVDKGADLIITDVTTSDVEALGVKVTKVIVPELQHMHMYEQDRCIARRTLEYGRDGAEKLSVDEVNQIPHPFG